MDADVRGTEPNLPNDWIFTPRKGLHSSEMRITSPRSVELRSGNIPPTAQMPVFTRRAHASSRSRTKPSTVRHRSFAATTLPAVD